MFEPGHIGNTCHYARSLASTPGCALSPFLVAARGIGNGLAGFFARECVH